jgi:hypothetical protein
MGSLAQRSSLKGEFPMKLSRLQLIFGCAAAALATAAPASATVYIEGRADGASFTLLDSGPTFASYVGPIGAFTLTATGAISLPAGTLAKLGSTLLAARTDTAAHTLDIVVSVTDLTAMDFKVLSGFTQQASPGWSVMEATWLDPSNTPFGLATLIDTKSYGILGADLDLSGSMSESSLFSLTHVYHVSVDALATGSSLSTVSASLLPTAVPEPGTWAMMLAGFGLAGVALRTRAAKQKVGYSA